MLVFIHTVVGCWTVVGLAEGPGGLRGQSDSRITAAPLLVRAAAGKKVNSVRPTHLLLCPESAEMKCGVAAC